MESDCIEYRDLPGQNPLFLAFFEEFERVDRFYHPVPLTDHDWLERVDQVKGQAHLDRQVLLGVLESLNRNIGLSEKSESYLRELARPEAVAVVTGQQVGLLGGPSYAVYKAVTAVQLVRRLRQLGIPAVPVFWMAADDSDFDEVCRTVFIDRQGGLVEVSHRDSRESEQQMVGTAQFGFPEEVGDLAEAGKLPPELLQQLEPDFRSGTSFRHAFACWIARLFSNHGLIVFDPLQAGYRESLKDFYRIAVENREELLEKSFRRKRELQALGFSPQVKLEESETFLFFLDGRERFKLEFRAGEYRVKGRNRLRWAPGQLVQALADGSVQVSPNVLLRPLVQDFLFPTAVGVVGPSEIAYFSQVSAISPLWSQRPLVLPRAAFTIVDRKSQRLLSRYALSVREVLSLSADDVMERIVRLSDGELTLSELDQLRACVEDQSGRLLERLVGEDPPLADMMSNARHKVFYQIDKVRRRYLLNQGFRNEVRRRHWDHLSNHLRPHGRLQERVVNFNTLRAEGGPQFIERLVELTDPECRAHRVLYL